MVDVDEDERHKQAEKNFIELASRVHCSSQAVVGSTNQLSLPVTTPNPAQSDPSITNNPVDVVPPHQIPEGLPAHVQAIPQNQSLVPYVDRLTSVVLALDDFVKDFYSKDGATKLKDASFLNFYTINQINMLPMMKYLVDEKVLHRLIVLDHIARRIDEITMSKYKYNLKTLNDAICKYLYEEYTGKVIVLTHSNPTTETQVKIVEEVFTQLQTDLNNAWTKKGNGDKKIKFHQKTSETGEWIADLKKIISANALLLDRQMGDHRAPGKLLVFSQHLTPHPSYYLLVMGMMSVTQQVTGNNIFNKTFCI